MGALDDFLSGGKGVKAEDMGFPKAAPKTDQRLQILQQELDDERAKLQSGDPRAQSNIDAINREINAISGKKTQPVAKPSGSALDDFLSGSQPQEKPLVERPYQPGEKRAELQVEIAGVGNKQPAPQAPQEPTLGEKLVGTGELALTALTGAVAPIVGGAAGIAENVLGGTLGTKEGLRKAEETAGKVSEALTYEPRTEAGKAVTGRAMEALQKAFEASKLPPVMPEVLPAVGAARKPVSEPAPKPRPITERIEPTAGKPKLSASEATQQLQQQFYGKVKGEQMAGIGAAKTADKAMLDEAIARATPELKQELSKIKPGDINVEALNRVMEADQLPVPVRYTRGQATQDPVLISRERNERGLKEQYVERFNEQNRALQENANLMKERVAPDINTTSFVEDAEGAIGRMADRIKADDTKISEAYSALRDYGAGKLEVDSQSFANGALKALSEFDEQEFLPSSILNRINAYKEGKTMNFNQFENLRTVLARETRKAQAANDGNAVHALTVVRSELEKMPLVGETEEAKVLADKARSLAKAQFDLLDKKRSTYNPLYADVMNGIADTKDFIPKLIIRAKNKDFLKTLESVSGDEQSLQHLRSGTLDYMIRESTDGSGNFIPKKFNKFVNILDINKKLDPLFGDQAKTIRALGNVSKNVEAMPAGEFVNKSGTAVAAAQMLKQYGSRLAARVPGVAAVVEPAQEIMEQRRTAKEVKQTLKPAAGVRLSDIGKKK